MLTYVYFGDSTQLTYLRARFYASGTGRFLTRDTWGGDDNNPMSYNLWNYTQSNPINYTDPSGNVPCSMLPPEDQVNCIAVPPPPDWWVNQTQIYVNGLGYFDTGHLRRGWEKGEWFIQQIETLLNLTIEAKTMLRRGYGGMLPGSMLPLARAKSAPSYWVDYAVSDTIREDQIHSVAYGMYIDFERGYEEYQDSQKFPVPRFLSGFAPGDLPSDHFGFWAYMNGYDLNQIPNILQCLGEVEVLFPQLFGIVGFYENHEFLPMISEHSISGSAYSLRNTAWPAFLEIQPIPSGPNTWQVLNRSFP